MYFACTLRRARTRISTCVLASPPYDSMDLAAVGICKRLESCLLLWYRVRVGGQGFCIRRLRCPRCLTTHALLPEDLCAYRDFKLTALEQEDESLEICCKPLFFFLPIDVERFKLPDIRPERR